MAFKEHQSSKSRSGKPGAQKYSTLKRMFREGFLSVCVYKNVFETRTFYDIVIYRKVRDRVTGEDDYRRGANLKPSDLPHLQNLIKEVDEFLKTFTDDEIR